MSNDAAEKVALADDLIWGASAIADELGVTVQSVYYLIRTHKIPVSKLGPKTVIASRRASQCR